MSSPAEIIRAALVQVGLVILPRGRGPSTTPCYVASLPDAPDQVVRIRDMVGLLFGRIQPTGKTLQHHGIKVTIRTLDFTGYDFANSILNGIETLTNFTVVIAGQKHIVQSAYRTTPLIDMGEEVGKKRQLWSFNARVAFADTEPSLG